jgi:UDP-N-acetylmuramate: L-alanyl-gamma-D-glutamyl-meso-diaminopimelate ligase
MKLGVHRQELPGSLEEADQVLVFRPPGLNWDLASDLASLGGKCRVLPAIDEIVHTAADWVREGDHVIVMSNGGFGGIHARLIESLSE